MALACHDEDPTNYTTITDKPRLFHLKDLSEFLNLVYKTEDELKDVTAFWESLMSKQKEDIEKKLLKLMWEPEWLPSSEDEIEIQKVFILQVTITDTEIVMVEREMAIYNITTDIEVIVMNEEEDFSSAVFDEEDGVFRGVKKFKNVYKTSLSVTFQCQFACSEVAKPLIVSSKQNNFKQ